MSNNIQEGSIYWSLNVEADKATKSLNKLGVSAKNLNRVFGLFKAGVFIKSLVQIGKAASNAAQKQMEFIQTQNLFNKTMANFVDKATEFRDRMESDLGMDPKKVMDSMTAFKRLAETFGITEDRAYLMSKNLTQLASDMTAYGYTFDLAMKKLKSGLAGKIFCLAYKGLYAVTHLIAGKSKRIMA